MTWYAWRWWRLAWTAGNDRRRGSVREHGRRWVRVGRGLYWRTGPRRLRRWLLRRVTARCPHEQMYADVLEGDGSHAVAWCPDCGHLRVVSRDTSVSHVTERTPHAATEASQYDVLGWGR